MGFYNFDISSFKFLSPGSLKCGISFVEGTTSDGDFLVELFSSRPSIFLSEIFTFNYTTITKDKTRLFGWKDLTVLVQIPHPTRIKFKFPP